MVPPLICHSSMGATTSPVAGLKSRLPLVPSRLMDWPAATAADAWVKLSGPTRMLVPEAEDSLPSPWAIRSPVRAPVPWGPSAYEAPSASTYMAS